MRWFVGWLVAGFLLWISVMIYGLLTSKGEPECTGLLVTATDDSFPPSCPSPWEGVLDVGPPLLGAAVMASLIGFAISGSFENRRTTIDRPEERELSKIRPPERRPKREP